MQTRLDVKMFDGGVTYTDTSADLAQICVEKCSAVSVYGFEKQEGKVNFLETAVAGSINKVPLLNIITLTLITK